ncbi:MAG TPA: TonB-dependent receptor [Steroidobacteraceae bacterium]|nr:TonB-dependent receptor [Steroidobacteraceae bacterium]
MLDELRSAGLTFIYNTQIVPSDLRIETEPNARAGAELAREILAAHGLALSQVAPNVFAVVASSSSVAHQPDRPPDSTSAPQAEVEEVVVQTSRYRLAIGQLASRTFLTQEQVKNMPRLADETLRAVQRLPGTTTNGFSSIGSVRGGEPNETAIVLDGLRLYEPFHLKNFLSPVSLLDSRLIDTLEFYSGGFPVMYGDRMSAIIDAAAVRPADPHYLEVGINLFHSSALAATQFADGRGHALVSARRSNVGDLVQLSENDFGEPQYSDGFARVDYEFSGATRAALETLISSDTIIARQEDGEQNAHAKYRNIYVWATVDHEWQNGAATRVIASYTDLENRRQGDLNEPGIRTAVVHDERLFHVIGLRVENDFAAGIFEHHFGAEVRRLWGDYDYSSEVHVLPGFPFPGSPGFDTSRTTEPSPEGYESSGYWDVRAQLDEHWALQGGVRIDTQTYDGSDDGEQWSPRLSVLYTLSPQTQLRASVGRFVQFQGINELQVEDGVDTFYPAQHAYHWILGMDHAFPIGLDLRVEAFLKDYRHINPRFENIFDPLVLLPEAEFDRVRIAPDGARASGFEMMARLRPHGSWSGWLSYSWSRAEDHIDGMDVPRSWDQRHAVNLGIVWAKGPWSATLTDSFHTGWPTTELQVTGLGTSNPQIDLSGRNRARLKDYNTLDFRVTRTFALPVGALDVFVEVNNATSRENECCVKYEVTRNPNGSLSYSRHEDSWLPLVPSAGVLWRY